MERKWIGRKPTKTQKYSDNSGYEEKTVLRNTINFNVPTIECLMFLLWKWPMSPLQTWNCNKKQNKYYGRNILTKLIIIFNDKWFESSWIEALIFTVRILRDLSVFSRSESSDCLSVIMKPNQFWALYRLGFISTLAK